nr:VCBS repeat-containing protein [Streptomyces jeddahensis]
MPSTGSRRHRRTRAGLRAAAATVGCSLLLTACGTATHHGPPAAKHRPVSTPGKAAARLPIPLGKGSRVADDFNGDGHRDLVLNDLVKGADDLHGDDPGIGIVYGGNAGSGQGRGQGQGLVPGARQLLSPAEYAAPTKGQLPAVFDAEASCDLDGDGFTDLVVSTDPPYDGQGQPPVPLQLLFGSPKGLTGKAVKLRIPARARFGNDWPDQPVCGDFDGDGAKDLVVHASGSRISYLRGPFSREGSPRAAGTPLAAPGNVPVGPSVGPSVDVDRDGYDDLLVRATAADASASSLVLGGPAGPTRTGAVFPAGSTVAFGRFGKGRGTDAAIGSGTGIALRYDVPGGTLRGNLSRPGASLASGDFDGDGLSELVVGDGDRLQIFKGRPKGLSAASAVTVTPRAQGSTQIVAVADFDGDKRDDLVVRTYRGETRDTVAVFPGRKSGLVVGEPEVTFSTAEFKGTA